MDADDEHPSSSLRHSEVASVENPVGPLIPEFCQATEECPKVAPDMTGQKSRNVLEEDDGRSVNIDKVEEGEGEAGSGTGSHASSLPGNAEVLAGEAAGPEGGVLPIATAIRPSPSRVGLGSPSYPIPDPVRRLVNLVVSGKAENVSEVWDSGPSLGEDGRGVRVDLGEADGPPSGTFEPHIESADP